MCCFCDILPEQAAAHRECYGNYAIALTKDWGIKNGISPVRYIHEQSPGVSPEYIKLKELFRETHKFRQDAVATQVRVYALCSLLLDKGALPPGPMAFRVAAQGGTSLSLLQQLEGEFDKTLESTEATTFVSFLNTLFNRICELHNELEKRDAFCRAYKEDFLHPVSGLMPDKVLYDEREWRSIRFIDETHDESHVEKYLAALRQKFLPPEYNLKFSNDDVQYIIVDSQPEKAQLLEFISNEVCLVDASLAPKICTFDELTSA